MCVSLTLFKFVCTIILQCASNTFFPFVFSLYSSRACFQSALTTCASRTACAYRVRFPYSMRLPCALPTCVSFHLLIQSALPMSQCVTSGTCHVSKTFCASHLLLVSRGLSSCASHLRLYPSHQSLRLYKSAVTSALHFSTIPNAPTCVSCSACRVLRVVF